LNEYNLQKLHVYNIKECINITKPISIDTAISAQNKKINIYLYIVFYTQLIYFIIIDVKINNKIFP